MNVLVIGKPKYNVILPVGSYPKEGSKISISSCLEISAGTSVYVACMLAKWGIKVYYVGAICGDEIGNKIKTELESYNVDTKYMEVDYEHKSNINYVMINTSNGISTEIFHDNEAFLKKYRYDILPDYIITDGTDMGASMAAANNYPKAKIIMLANKVSDEYYNLSKRCVYVCANMDYAKALTKMDFEFNRAKSLVNLFQKIKDLNKADYILMLREKGVLYTKERQVKMIPSIKVEKKDDANSGSAFFGAYCYGILNNLDMDIIAKTANIAGGLALTKIGTLTSIPDKNEVFTMAGLKDAAKIANGIASSNESQASIPLKNSSANNAVSNQASSQQLSQSATQNQMLQQVQNINTKESNAGTTNV